MLTSCVLDKLVLSVPVVLFLISIDQETWNHLFEIFEVHGKVTRVMEIDSGSVWLKMGRPELYFQLSHVNESTQALSYLKQT